MNDNISNIFDGFWPSLISNLVCASIIALAAAFAGWNLRSPGVAHALWILVLLKLITPPMVPLPIPVPIWIANYGWKVAEYRQIEKQPDADQALLVSSPPEMLPLDSIEAVRLVEMSDLNFEPNIPVSGGYALGQLLLVGLVGIWLAIAIVLLLRSLMRSWQFSKLVHQRGRNCEAADEILFELARRSGVSRVPRVKLIAAKVSPMLLGIGPWKRIVCPQSLWNDLDDNARSAFLSHELGHFHRKDHWVRCIELIAGSLFWWLPLVHLARRQIERMEETCCDLWASRCLALGPRTYAESLLVVVDFLSDQGCSMPQLATGMTPSKTLEERLRAIMNAKPLDELTPSKRGLLAIVSVFVLSIQITTASDASNASLTLGGLDYKRVPNAPVNSSMPGDDSGTASENATFDPTGAVELPEPPRGWWSRSLPSTFFEFPLEFDQSVLQVYPLHSIYFSPKAGYGRSPSRYRIPEREPTAMIALHEGRRLVLANRMGELRIWDTQSQQSVSLLGSHQSAIQSIAYHPEHGLLAADYRGNLFRWDIQSGAIQDSWSSDGEPIQSVRFNGTGSMFAVVLGDWKQQNEQGASVVIFDSNTMSPRIRFHIESPVAILVADANHWYSVDWNGGVGQIDRISWTSSSIGSITKSDLIQVLFTQDFPMPFPTPNP